jgi:hypothetical protein
MVTIRILKNGWDSSIIRILYFLVLCRLTNLIQDIGVSEFDSSAFIKAYIVGISV